MTKGSSLGLEIELSGFVAEIALTVKCQPLNLTAQPRFWPVGHLATVAQIYGAITIRKIGRPALALVSCSLSVFLSAILLYWLPFE